MYAFSTENWKRPLKERNYLFRLLEIYLIEKLEKLNNEKIKIKILGEKKFYNKLNKLLDFAEKKTIRNTKLQINLALNYGSKKEIVYAFNKLKKKTRFQKMILIIIYIQKIFQILKFLYEQEILKDLAIFFYGKLHIQRYFLKKNYGQILSMKI